MALPKYVAIKSDYNSKYLRYIHEDGEIHKFLQFSGDEVLTPYTKFEVQPAVTGDDDLVHIRCCYNNKYLQRARTECWIIADADEPQEDQSKWNCTLFQPFISSDDNKKVRLRHVALGDFAALWRVPPPRNDCLLVGSTSYDPCNKLIVIDWESLAILPKHIAFKGDNGCYLSAGWTEGYEYLQFSSNNVRDSSVWNQVFVTNNGDARIKSKYYGKFWRRSPNWIWGDSTDTTGDNPDTVFSVVSVSGNTIALRNQGNNYFCKRLTTEGKTDCLNAGVQTFTNEAHLEFEDLLASRRIYSINFKVAEARIYGRRVVTLATGEAINPSEEAEDMAVKLVYEEKQSGTWRSTVTVKRGVVTDLESRLPVIGEGGIEVGEEYKRFWYEWRGEAREWENHKEREQIVRVPGKTEMVVKLLATEGHCDIPFSYVQNDTHINGENEVYFAYDGIYSGVNYYHFEIEKVEKPMPM